MQTVNVRFADGREITVELLHPVNLRRAREICVRRFSAERVVEVRPHEGALLNARQDALQSIRDMGL